MGAVSPRPILLKSPAASPSEGISDRSQAPRPITKLSISKNYTIPPRPKPGRKPNNEVPPSRRKAQNREAQRAFRERKSQAVRVLEQQLAKQQQEFEQQQQQMKEQILLLQRQNMQLQYTPSSPQSPQPIIMSQIPLTSGPIQAQIPTSPMSLYPVTYPGPASVTPSSSGSSRHTSPHESPHPSQHPSPQYAQSPGSPFGTPVTPSDVVGLELLDQVLEQRLPSSTSHSRSQSVTSLSGRSPRRRLSVTGRDTVVRTSPPQTNTPLDLVKTNWSQPAVPLRRASKGLEVDFTAAFTPRSPRPLQLRDPPSPKDRCGFCTDNSPCICAATAAREEGSSNELAPDLGTLGSPVTNNFQSSPPPAQSPAQDIECTGNPGNCSSCRQDPMLTLFCSAVSSKPASASLSAYSTYIPAQAAYKTLSRHPRFGNVDLGMIVEILQVRSSQVEVNSVAKALRILDTK